MHSRSLRFFAQDKCSAEHRASVADNGIRNRMGSAGSGQANGYNDTNGDNDGNGDNGGNDVDNRPPPGQLPTWPGGFFG